MGLVYLLDTGGWIGTMLKLFSAVRLNVYASTSIVPIASALAALFVVMRYILIITDIQSDDQAGGFGHVPLKEIIRPMVFYCLVLSSGYLVTTTDRVTTNISTQMCNAIPSSSAFFDTKETWDKQMPPKFQEAKKQLKEDIDAKASFYTLAKDFFAFMKALFENLPSVVIVVVFSIIIDIIAFVFKFILIIMLGVGQMNLCIMGFFLPIAFALSILKPWESTYQKAIGYYVEYSLWAPIGLLLLYIASVAGSSANAAFEGVISELPVIKTILNLVTSLLVMIVKAVFMAVAIFAFMQIPQIANKALALGSPIEDVHHGAGQIPRNAAQAGKGAGQAIAKALTKS